MLEQFITMNGYGQFVWSAFIFSFISCFYLYSKTRSELKRQEKIFMLEFEQKAEKIEFIKRKKVAQRVLSIN